jgi:hypothetical protein
MYMHSLQTLCSLLLSLVAVGNSTLVKKYKMSSETWLSTGHEELGAALVPALWGTGSGGSLEGPSEPDILYNEHKNWGLL